MEKSKKYYWALFHGEDVIFEGSFNDCWKHLTEQYADETVANLVKQHIRISRSN